jgi:hypothetical protein
MAKNLYQVKKEKDIDKILDDYMQTLVITMYVTSTCDISRKFKSKFIEISKLFPQYYFVYININEFETSTQKYTKSIKETPLIVIYMGKQPLTHTIGPEYEYLINIIKSIGQQLENKAKELEEEKKITQQLQLAYVLGKLDCLKDLGIELSKEFNMQDDINVMIKEYKSIKDNYTGMTDIPKSISNNSSDHQNIQDSIPIEDNIINVTDNNSNNNNSITANNEAKKMEKIKEAENITLLKQNIEMRQLAQLQQLKRIYKLKQEAEEKNKNKK